MQCDEDQQAQVIVGTSGGCRIWVNDELVFSQHKRHSDFSSGKFRAVVNLRQGWSKLLIKVEGEC